MLEVGVGDRSKTDAELKEKDNEIRRLWAKNANLQKLLEDEEDKFKKLSGEFS